MAYIDKTYTNSYEDYKEFKDWANKQVVTFFDGHTRRVGDYVYCLEKDDFTGTYIPIMTSPVWLDIYLIQNCKIEFILDTMKEVYNEEDYNSFLNIDLTEKPPSNFQKNRKITIRKNSRTKFNIHNKPYYGYWFVQHRHNPYNVKFTFSYNKDTKIWVSDDMEYYPTNSMTAMIPSMKSIVRHLRKQYLPKGIAFDIRGRYVGECYTAYVH